MFLYADRTVCPRCRAPLPALTAACARCHADLDGPAAYDVFVALQAVDRLVAELADRPLVASGAAITGAAEPSVALRVTSSGRDTAGPAPRRAHRPTVPPVGAAPRHVPVLSGLTVPKILLGLGALCLVVAAVVFLAVAWSALGVGGRTAVLVGFTGAAAGLAAWSARSSLRAGAESLTTVALGLFLLDLAGARSSGWFGDLGVVGFAVLAGILLALAATSAAIATRRTPEPRLLSAEVVVLLGTTAALVATAGFEWATPALWTLGVTLSAAAIALVCRALRLGVPTTGLGGVACLAWVGLVATGLVRAATHPAWEALWAGRHAWPLLAAAVVAAAPAAVGRLPITLRVGACSVAVLLLSLLLACPGLDEDAVPATLTLVAVIALHAAAATLLPHPWRLVTAVPLGIAGSVAALLALAAAVTSLTTSNLLDHGLWTGDSSAQVATDALPAAWSILLPLTVAAAFVAVAGLLRIAGSPAVRAVLTPAATTLVAAASLSPVIVGVPRYVAVLVLVAAAGSLVTWALLRRRAAGWLAAAPLGVLAVGAALADDGLTIGVLVLLTAACAAAEHPRSPARLQEAAHWALPAALGGTTWALASAYDVDGGWRAAPVVAAVAALALARPSGGHETSGLAVSLAAITVSSGFVPVDLRLVAGQLTATGLAATLVGLLRRREATLVGMALLAAAGLAAWPDAVTAVVVLATGLAVSVLHEVRRAAPVADVARAATPVAAAALLWAAGDLAGLSGGWTGVPVVVVLGVLLAWKADVAREVPAAVAALCVALASPASLPDPQAWTAVYLTLGGVACTASALLHADRRRVGWVGLALLTLATWLRLDQLGVGTVEAYTLPLAVVLLVLGTVALLRGERSSLQTQGSGLALALVPSLLQALADPVALRAVLLGAGCVAAVTVGVQRRWAAPLLAGGGTLAVLVLRQMTMAQALPQWALIGLAGTALTFVGLTWEKRLANVRTAAGYLRGLR
ncbi:SCO7613 C-terminal domain-containing membrane protein [Nocardioides jiangxiensis]|uniref:DUF2157 domain-containing protein n=1 Tax=Nocardioides jiangxiensis TaxID=3064524 RepID=A0ABT9AZS0_9ACTN|nr:hypothetical protein [Nocardioides sp. WY-20]MDO7867893.1 hypothetical protein [Nocardioides sp. WY-20]